MTIQYKRNPRIVTRHAGGVRAGADGNAQLQHFPHRRSSFGGLLAVTIHEIFALIGHAMLDGDAAAQRFDAFQISVGNRFAMVEEPVQSFERHFAVHFLKHIQKAGDAFVVSGVQAERPFVRGQQRNDLLQFTFQRSRQDRGAVQENLQNPPPRRRAFRPRRCSGRNRRPCPARSS